MRILVTGATGYIGGRLIPRLLEAGDQVRVLVRDARRIEGRPWLEDVEVAVGDVLTGAGVASALDGIETAYCLVHSMTTHPDFETADRTAAERFAASGASL